MAWTLLGLGAVSALCYPWLPVGLANGFGYLAVAALGLVMSCLGAAFVHGSRRRIWVAIAAGQAAFFVGDVLWVVQEDVLHVSAFPSVADVFFACRYLLVILGMVWLIRGRQRGRDRTALLDAAIISTGFAVVGAEFVVIPAAIEAGEGLLSGVVVSAYPVADLLLLALLVRLFTGGTVRSPSLWALAGGTLAMLAADTQFALGVGAEQYAIWVDLGWLAAYLLIGFAALHPSVDRLSEPTGQGERITLVRMIALGAALGLMPATELIRDLLGYEGVSVPVIAGATVAITLVLIRIWDLLRSLQAHADQLAELARNDSLTGVANRRTWDHELARACSEALDHGQPLVVALIDLDDFKAFNDTHGHVMGDLVLTSTTAAWTALLDSRGFLARYGGEEFSLLLPDTHLDDAKAILDRLRGAVSHEQTCSIGAVVWDGREHPDAVVSRADQALYLAKRTGRDRVVTHDTPPAAPAPTYELPPQAS